MLGSLRRSGRDGESGRLDHRYLERCGFTFELQLAILETGCFQSDSLGELQAREYLASSGAVCQACPHVDVVAECGHLFGATMLAQQPDIGVADVNAYAQRNPGQVLFGVPGRMQKFDSAVECGAGIVGPGHAWNEVADGLVTGQATEKGTCVDQQGRGASAWSTPPGEEALGAARSSACPSSPAETG